MKNKLTNLFSGTLIAAEGIDSGIFKDVGKLFGGAAGSPVGSGSVGDLIVSVVDILLLVAGGIAVVFIIIGGFQYVLSRGNEEATETAKKTLQNSILGLVIIPLSFAMVRIIAAVLLQGRAGTGIL